MLVRANRVLDFLAFQRTHPSLSKAVICLDNQPHNRNRLEDYLASPQHHSHSKVEDYSETYRNLLNNKREACLVILQLSHSHNRVVPSLEGH